MLKHFDPPDGPPRLTQMTCKSPSCPHLAIEQDRYSSRACCSLCDAQQAGNMGHENPTPMLHRCVMGPAGRSWILTPSLSH